MNYITRFSSCTGIDTISGHFKKRNSIWINSNMAGGCLN